MMIYFMTRSLGASKSMSIIVLHSFLCPLHYVSLHSDFPYLDLYHLDFYIQISHLHYPMPFPCSDVIVTVGFSSRRCSPWSLYKVWRLATFSLKKSYSRFDSKLANRCITMNKNLHFYCVLHS